jgi:type 1 glutamine amidotransferase
MKTSYSVCRLTGVMILAVLVGAVACGSPEEQAAGGEQEAMEPPGPPHIVFVTGDEEYRSEESMPMIARILKRDYGFDVTVRYALDDRGIIDPNNLTNIPGLAALEDADLMVLYTRFRALPDSQLQYILDFAESGKPMVGFRTATHAFRYEDDSTHAYLNEEWPQKVFGQHWITHHGHFDDGANPLTNVQYIAGQQDHPVLRGVEPFQAYSWLYHVDGGAYRLYGDSRPLLEGTAIKSGHAQNNRLDEFPLTNPVAWTKTYTGTSGVPARVFFTTLGHPYDFREEPMRKLALNGILWALGREDEIPPEGADATVEGAYEPNNSGFGDRFKPGQRPADL